MSQSVNPSRLLVLMFTDIVGSLELKRRLGDPAYIKLLARHNRLFLDALNATGTGRVIKETGDGFMASFDATGDAVVAALQFMHGLSRENSHAEPLRVRVGIHVGEVSSVPIDGLVPQVIGLAADVAARLMGAAWPGQILLTRAAYDSARQYVRQHPPINGEDPPAIQWLAHGSYVFKGSENEPIEVFEVGAVGIAPLRAPAESENARRPAAFGRDREVHNLPAPLTPFIGRVDPLAELAAWVGSTHDRLLTLTGAGGGGKTRLAIEAARRNFSCMPDGAWLAELAGLNEPALLPAGLASVWGLQQTPGRSMLEVVTDFLREKHLLLVLDNCEHLIEGCARLVQHLLERSPGLRVLATSREPLGVSGERAVAVPALEVPEPGASPRGVAESEAGKLFVQRASAVRRGFVIDADNAPTVAELCRRLDGAPLALELAAARVKALSPRQILDRLKDRFALLGGGERAAPDRHKTLRATIDWSYQLLSDDERRLLRRLTVFDSGWTLEAAEAIDEGVPVLDLLSSLIDKSLVVADATDPPRYRMLESIRHFGLEKLDETAEEEPTRQRHFDFFVQLAKEAEVGMRGPQIVRWLHALDRDQDNLRDTLAWAQRDTARAARGIKMAGHLLRYWVIRSRFDENITSIQVLLGLLSPSDAATRAEAMCHLGVLYDRSGDELQARLYCQDALQIAQTIEDRRIRARALCWHGPLPGVQDYPRALEPIATAVSEFRSFRDEFGLIEALHKLGLWKTRWSDNAGAAECLEEAVALARAHGDLYCLSRALTGLALALSSSDRYLPFAQEAVDVCRHLGDELGSSEPLRTIAAHQGWQGDSSCLDLFDDLLRAKRRRGVWGQIMSEAASAGEMAISLGQFDRAEGYLSEAIRLAIEHQQPSFHAHYECLMGQSAHLRGAFADAEMQYRRALDRSLTASGGLKQYGYLKLWACVVRRQGRLDEAQAAFRQSIVGHRAISTDLAGRAMCLVGFAGLAGARGHGVLAAKLLGVAASVMESEHHFYHADKWEWRQTQQEVRAALGDVAYEEAWRAGQSLSLDEAELLALDGEIKDKPPDA